MANENTPIFEVFPLISLGMDFSLNQTLLTFLLYVKQTWKSQLILKCLCEVLSAYNSKDAATNIHGLAFM